MRKQCFFILMIALKSTDLCSATSEQAQKLEAFTITKKYALDDHLPAAVRIMRKHLPKTDKSEESMEFSIDFAIPINNTTTSLLSNTPPFKGGQLEIGLMLLEEKNKEYVILAPFFGITENKPEYMPSKYNFSWRPAERLSDLLTQNGIIFRSGNKAILDTMTLLYYHLIRQGGRKSIDEGKRYPMIAPLFQENMSSKKHTSLKLDDFSQTFNHHKTKNPQLFAQTEKMAQILFDTFKQSTKLGAEQYLNAEKLDEFKKAFHEAKKAASVPFYFTKPFIFGSSLAFISALLGYFAYQKYRMK